MTRIFAIKVETCEIKRLQVPRVQSQKRDALRLCRRQHLWADARRAT